MTLVHVVKGDDDVEARLIGSQSYLIKQDVDLESKAYQWNHYLVTPCENILNCLVGTMFPCANFFYNIYHGMNLNFICSILLVGAVPCQGVILFIARGKVRSAYNLEGSMIMDLIMSLICCPLVNCQLSDEIMYLHRTNLWKKAKEEPKSNVVLNFIKKIINPIFGEREFLIYARKQNLTQGLNPETAITHYGRFYREYRLYLIKKANAHRNGEVSEEEKVESEKTTDEVLDEINFSNIPQMNIERY